MLRRKFAPKSPSALTNNNIEIKEFRGIDTNSSMLNVANNHATSLENFLYKNGVVQKRKGWTQVCKEKILNVWEYKIGSTDYTIAHIGTGLYTISKLGNGTYSKTLIVEASLSLPITNSKSFGVIGGETLYIWCGGYYMLYREDNSWVFEKVYNNAKTFIPTVSQGGYCENSGMVDTRRAYDDINMLSDYRKETFNSKVSDNYVGSSKSFILAGTPNSTSITKEGTSYQSYEGLIIVDVFYSIVVNGVTQYKNDKLKCVLGKVPLLGYVDCLIKDGTTMETELGPDNNRYIKESTVYGTIGSKQEAITIELKNDYGVNPIESDDNITVTYKVVNNDHELIENCNFGILFGCNGAKNRVFVSGNSDYPNQDWHSTERNYTSEEDKVNNNMDFTYFSPLDYCQYGTTKSKVMGYQILSNGYLAVIKEKYNNDPCIYFRKPTYTEAISYDGVQVKDNNNNVLYEEVYPTYSSNIDKGLISSDGVVNYDGDVLYLTKEGMCSVTFSDDLAKETTYAINRSVLINNVLTKEELMESHSIVYNEKLYIGFNNGTVYVADKAGSTSNIVENNIQYEWYILRNVCVENWIVINGELYYSNNEGTYLVDTEKERYSDDIFTPILAADITLENSNIATKCIAGLELITNNYIKNGFVYKDFGRTVENNAVVSNDKYGLLFDSNAITYDNETSVFTWDYGDETILYNGEEVDLNTHCQKRVYNDMEVYLDNVDNYTNCSEIVGKKFIVSYEEGCEFELYYGENITINDTEHLIGDKFELDISHFRVSYKIPPNEELIVANLNTTTSEFNLIYRLGEPVNFIQYNGTINIFRGLLWERKPIRCHYFTKAYDFGTMVNCKFLNQITIANDSKLPSEIDFGYKTFSGGEKWYTKVYNSYVGNEWEYIDGQLVFGTGSFESVTYNDETFTSAYTKRMYGRRFNFIMFIFKNVSYDNSVVSNMNIEFSVGMKYKGVV